MRKILPQYNNTLTKEWLVTVMQDLGFRCAPPQIGIKVERKGSLMRVVARLKFQKTTSATIGSTRFTFKRNASFRLFFSYRYQADHLPPLLRRYGLAVSKQWITHSGEEGIFLCQRC